MDAAISIPLVFVEYHEKYFTDFLDCLGYGCSFFLCVWWTSPSASVGPWVHPAKHPVHSPLLPPDFPIQKYWTREQCAVPQVDRWQRLQYMSYPMKVGACSQSTTTSKGGKTISNLKNEKPVPHLPLAWVYASQTHQAWTKKCRGVRHLPMSTSHAPVQKLQCGLSVTASATKQLGENGSTPNC